MQGYLYFILAIVIAGGAACTRTHSRANNFMRRRDANPQARDRIHKTQNHDQTNEHSKNNYHELKHPKKNYDQLKHPKNNYHQREHAIENHHKIDHQKDNHDKRKNKKNHPDLKHNDKLKYTNEKFRNRVNSSHLDTEDVMNFNETSTKHEKPDIKFPKTYHATGLLTLPYDGIMEPFEIWYAEDLNMSRIDYYHGVDKTFQRGDLKEYGVYIKEIPMHKIKVGDNNKNSKSCWYDEGDEYDVVKPQSIVPMDLSHFKVIGEEYRSGTLTIKLRRHLKTGNLKNTYTLWVSKEKPHRPIRYETEGFDLLLEGSYDHYYLDYITFSDWYFDYLIMEVPKGSWCYREALHAKSRYFVNPMSEFIHKPHEIDKHHKRIEKEFKKYKLKHGKSYKDVKEHSKRRNIYRHNARFIRSKNRARLNYTLSVNHLADLTPEEFRIMDNLLHDEDVGVNSEFLKDQFPSHDDEVPLVNYTEPNQPLPENLDWREYGVISPVRGQSMCGSCWAFSTAGMLEGVYKIATGKDIEFSAQMLVDCTYGFKNYGCRGGWPWKAMQWVMKNGIATRKSYGRYLAEEGLCHCGPKDNCEIVYPTSFGDVLGGNRTTMKGILATYGPVAVGINSAPKSFKFYREGVYDDFDCDDLTEHTVIIVGYGKQPYGLNYWLIKNSWGPFWGRKGYMKISNDVDTCGILSSNGIVANFRNNSYGFPFERMKKVVTPHYSNTEGRKDLPKPLFESIPFQ